MVIIKVDEALAGRVEVAGMAAALRRAASWALVTQTGLGSLGLSEIQSCGRFWATVGCDKDSGAVQI